MNLLNSKLFARIVTRQNIFIPKYTKEQVLERLETASKNLGDKPILLTTKEIAEHLKYYGIKNVGGYYPEIKIR